MRWRWKLGSIVLTLTALTGLVLFARGTWAVGCAVDPTCPADGVTVGIMGQADGTRCVRAAIHLPQAADEVWQVITDYDHYGDICSFLRAAEMECGPDGCRVRGRVDTALPSTLPFAMELRHCQELYRFRSTWDEASGSIEVNRGGWVVEPRSDGGTLLAIHLEIQVRGVPTFLLRNLSRHRLPRVLRAVEHRLMHGSSGRSWQ